MSTELNMEKFDAFLFGRMTKKEQTEFLRQLEDDPDLKAEFETYRQLSEGIEKAFLKEELAHIHQATNGKKKKRHAWMAVAASLALAIIGAYWFFQPSKSEQLYAKYFRADPGLPTVMGNVGTRYEFYEAMIDYKTENYSTAIAKWDALLEKYPESDTLNYYLGMAYLNNKNYDKSGIYLQKNTVQTSPEFKESTLWYRALIHLQANRQEEAVKLLKQLDTEQSKELLSELLHGGN